MLGFIIIIIANIIFFKELDLIDVRTLVKEGLVETNTTSDPLLKGKDILTPTYRPGGQGEKPSPHPPRGALDCILRGRRKTDIYIYICVVCLACRQ